MLTDAEQGGRQLLAMAAQSCHCGPVAGTWAVTTAARPGLILARQRSIRYRQSQAIRGVTSVMSADGQDDRADVHELLR